MRGQNEIKVKKSTDQTDHTKNFLNKKLIHYATNHTGMDIFNKLNNQPHLQDIIVGHYKCALNKDHVEHDERKLYEHHYSLDLMLGIKIPDDAYEYRLPIISDEINNELTLLNEGLKCHLKRKGWSKKKINKRWVKKWIFCATDNETANELKHTAVKKRIRIVRKRINSAIKIQSVVRGWLSRR
jgi:hypothetical protein